MSWIPLFFHLRQVLYCVAAIGFSTTTMAHEPPTATAVLNSGVSSAVDGPSIAVDAFHAALARGDHDAALATLADDVQIYEQGWVEHSKAEYAALHLASDVEFSAVVSSTQTARSGAVADDMAYVNTESRMTGKFNNKNIDSISLESVVLRRVGGEWRIAHIHWSSRDAKK
jgi:ketosteroid isomerase-like protein